MQRFDFFDDQDVPARVNVERVVHRPRKHRANPVMEGECPWEADGAGFEWPTVLFDEEDGLFKAWYEGHADGTDYGCYAVSIDGLHWQRPELGLVAFRGSKKNNIFRRGTIAKFRAICVNVIKRAPADWHLFYWDAMTPKTRRGVIHFTSADGVRWQRGKVNPVVQTPVDRTESGGVEDVLRVSYDRVDGQFLLSMRTLPLENLDKPLLQKRVPGGLTQRRVSLATSRDGVRFTPMRTVLTPELNDPYDVQFYGLSPFRFGERFLGLLQTFRTDVPCIDVELAHARDLASWRRVAPNVRYIPNGRSPAVDCGLIHPISDPVRVGDKLYIYYWGSNNDHRGGTIQGLPKRDTLCLAVADARRIVSLRAGGSGGSVMIGPVKIRREQRLLLNADPRGGEVRVGLRHPETYHELPGFDRESCQPLTASAYDHAVAWQKRSDLASLRGRTLFIQVALQRGDLFDVTLE